jgi:hypothetical protein
MNAPIEFFVKPGSTGTAVSSIESPRASIERRLTEIQTELDEIGPTFGMQARRAELTREKNALLDQLLESMSVNR